MVATGLKVVIHQRLLTTVVFVTLGVLALGTCEYDMMFCSRFL